ncbi:MAG: DUF2586 family protein, partial [Cytophagales bacterium]|nr:DUF2586 family protein [Cytophagales bacterium]
MPLNDVKFTHATGGLGRTAPSEDHISGLIFYEMDPSMEGTFVVGAPEELANRSIASFNPNNKDEELKLQHIVYYHVQEFFRMNPTGKLYVKIVGKGKGEEKDRKYVKYSEVQDLQFFAKRSIRQIGIYDPAFDSDASMTTLGQITSDLEENESAPVSILIQGKQSKSLKNLPSLAGSGSKYVSVLLGESMSGLAGKMRAGKKAEVLDNDVLIGLVGTALGAVSKAAVHENIGW